MKQQDLTNEILCKYYKALALRVEREPELIHLCQIEIAKVLANYPLSVAENIQKNKLFNFNALEFIGVVKDYDTQGKYSFLGDCHDKCK